MTRIVVAGENLIDLIARADGSIRAIAGGGPYNTARSIGRLGGDVAYLGRVSLDRFGQDIAAHLAADGVDRALVARTDEPTLLALAELDASGGATYRFYVDGTAAVGLSAEDAARALDPAPDALHVGTLGLVLEPMADTLAQLVAAAPPSVLVMVDPNCRPSIVRHESRYRARLDAVLSRADVVKVSTDDVAWLAPGADARDWAARLLERGPRVVLVTAGAGGVAVVTPGGTDVVAVPPVEVVDTVGAGDAFGGAFLLSWLERGLARAALDDRASLRSCVERAVLVARITCGRAGADPPTRAELEAAGG